MHETEGVFEDFSSNKEIFHFINYSGKSKNNYSNKSVIGKIKDETAGVVIE